MNPADELRAAADKLRKLIQNTAPAPWWGDDLDEVQSPLGQIARTLGSGDGKAPYPNSRYIAAMHPGVGTALADWLQTASANAAALTWPNDFIKRALAVARAINGGAP
jgi:hypothetical protein